MLRIATSSSRGGFGSPRRVNGFARGSPTRGAAERSEAERLYEGQVNKEKPMREIIMGYQGEMSLKGLNRNQFESAMMKILRYRLKTVGKFKVYCTQSTFYMEPEEEIGRASCRERV